jgi:hypothetical protein
MAGFRKAGVSKLMTPVKKRTQMLNQARSSEPASTVGPAKGTSKILKTPAFKQWFDNKNAQKAKTAVKPKKVKEDAGPLKIAKKLKKRTQDMNKTLNGK